MSNRYETPWTPEVTAKLYALIEQRKGVVETAEAMGMTQSQVSGKAQRLGMGFGFHAPNPFAALAWHYGSERSAAVASGKDAATNEDLNRWRSLGGLK